jgi:hypothetical protein
LYSNLITQLVSTISKRQIALIDADLDDCLIDLELHDVVDVVNVVAALSKSLEPTATHVPRLFNSEAS